MTKIVVVDVAGLLQPICCTTLVGGHSLCCIDVQSGSLLFAATNVVNDVNEDDIDEVRVVHNFVGRDETMMSMLTQSC